MGPSRILTVVILIAIVTTVMLVIADTAFAQVQPTPTTMLKCFKELYDATWFFAFLARAYDELLHVNSSRRYLLISPCRDEERPRVQAFPPLLSARLPANGPATAKVAAERARHMVRLLEDPTTMRPLYERAWRVFCDSRVLSRLAWFSGLRLPVITGSDLTARLIARAEEQRLTIALIGPTAAACAALGSR